MPSPRIVVALALACLMGACAAPKPHLKAPPADPVNGAWGLAVYPVTLRLRTSGYQAYARGRALAEQLSQATGRPVFGPGEFRVEDFDSPDLRRGTNLLGALRFSKTRRPEDFYAIRGVVEQRVTSVSAAAFDADGNAKGGGGRETIDVVVRLELLSMGKRDVVTEIEGIARVDPFNIDPEKDPYPDVTRLTKELADALVDEAGLRSAKPAEPLGLRASAVPGPALEFGTQQVGSERDELKKLDALEQDARLYGIIRQIEPEAPRTRLRLYRTATHGLVVQAAEGRAAAAGLQPDDLVLSCNGDPVTGQHVLDRHLAAGPVKLKVKRAGEDVELELR